MYPKGIFLREIRTVCEYINVFLKTSSFHGFNHLVDKKIKFTEKLLWLCIISFGLSGAATLSWWNWRRYQNTPIVISMERDYKQWNTSFPAVTFCPDVKVDKEALSNLSKSRGIRVGQLVAQLAVTTYANLNELKGDFPEELLSPEDYMRLILQVTPEFKHQATGNGPVTPEVVTTITEMGICYTFNSNVAIYASPRNFWSDSWSINDSFSAMQGSPLGGETFVQILGMRTGTQVYVHAPHEVPDSSSRSISLKKNHYLELSLGAVSIYSSEDTKALSISQRHCRFLDEAEDLQVSPVYSYNLCRSQCRLELAMKLCHCIPHFYRTRDEYPICSFQEFKCLGRHQKTLITLRNEKEGNLCDCLPACNYIKYVIEMEEQVGWQLETVAKWYINKYPHMRLKREVIFGFTDLLVSIGGTAGLFLGASILSFIEVFYFFTLRLYWFLQYRKPH